MTQDSTQADEIRGAVREHYGSRINDAAGCCGADCCGSTAVALYGAEEIGALPEGVVTASFGCGNPLALAGLRPGEVVLDLGSGGGLDVLLAARRVGPEGYVYGLDMTDEMLAVARRNAEQASVANVEFLKGDIEDIPLPGASVDTIISNCVINLAPDKGQALREAYRVLKPGGRLAVSDIVVDGDLSDLPVSEAQVRAALSWAGCIAGALTIAEYQALLAEAGFEAIEVTVRGRLSADDLRDGAAPDLQSLAPELLEALAARFTSSGITARRPA